MISNEALSRILALPKNCDASETTSDIRVLLRRQFQKAVELHQKEHDMVLDSMRVLYQLDRQNAAGNLGLTRDQYIEALGLSPDVYWKRLQAAKVLAYFPAFVELFKTGQTHVSQLAMVLGKITAANADLILEGIRNKTKRECEAFLSRVTFEGTLLPGQETIQITLTLTLEEMALLDRAREVLNHGAGGGHVPKNAEVVISALGDLLEHRNPLRKAERAKQRQEKKEQGKSSDKGVAPGRTPTEIVVPVTSVPVTSVPDSATPEGTPSGKKHRSQIPMAVRHEVWSRDDGRCTWTEVDGSRCKEKFNLELDHVQTMHCHGGTHDVENLALTCRRHNQLSAREKLGEEFYAKKRQEWDLTL